MITPILATLDRDLTIHSITGCPRDVVGESAYELVPSSHHYLLKSARRELFVRGRLVSCEVPTRPPNETEACWWFVRAAPVCEGARVVAAIAHAVPSGERAERDLPPVSAEVWQRELALRDLMPILSCFNVKMISALGLSPSISESGVQSTRRGFSHPSLRPDRER